MNAMAAESMLIARLKLKLAGTVTVCSFASIFGAASLGIHLPLVAVALVKSAEGDNPLPHTTQISDETWQVSVFSAQQTDLAAFAQDFQSAGALIGDVIGALSGFKLGVGFQPLRYLGIQAVSGSPGEIEFQTHFGVKRTSGATP